MSFTLPTYYAPDFEAESLNNAPNVQMAPAPMDGVAPEGYHATGIYPEYFHIDGVWHLAEESRMDCVPVWEEGRIRIIEFRRLKKGQMVVLGRTEDGSEGIYVHMYGFAPKGEKDIATLGMITEIPADKVAKLQTVFDFGAN